MPRKKYRAGQLITITTPIRRVLRIKRVIDSKCSACRKCHIQNLHDNYILVNDYDMAEKLNDEVCLGLCQKIPIGHYFAKTGLLSWD